MVNQLPSKPIDILQFLRNLVGTVALRSLSERIKPTCYIYRYRRAVPGWRRSPDVGDASRVDRPNSCALLLPSDQLLRVTIEMTDVLTGNIATPRCRMSSGGSREWPMWVNVSGPGQHRKNKKQSGTGGEETVGHPGWQRSFHERTNASVSRDQDEMRGIGIAISIWKY